MARDKQYTVVLDLDGTLVENKWPDLGDWMPGAIDACHRLHRAGFKLVVFSARLSPYDPFTSQAREPAEVMSETLKVRNLLDEAGLYFVDIWTTPGKPGGFVYVDDRAERYHGRPGSWAKLAEKIIIRAGMTDPEFPAFDQVLAKGETPQGGSFK